MVVPELEPESEPDSGPKAVSKSAEKRRVSFGLGESICRVEIPSRCEAPSDKLLIMLFFRYENR